MIQHWIVLIMLSLLALPAAGARSETETAGSCILSVGWSPTEPFQYMEGDEHSKQLTGLDVKLLSKALSLIGCEARFIELTWSEQLERLQAGTLDVALAAARYPEREEYAWFSAPSFAILESCLWYRAAPSYPHWLARLPSFTSLIIGPCGKANGPLI